jgi:hypothetical protein
MHPHFFLTHAAPKGTLIWAGLGPAAGAGRGGAQGRAWVEVRTCWSAAALSLAWQMSDV